MIYLHAVRVCFFYILYILYPYELGFEVVNWPSQDHFLKPAAR